MAGYIALFVTGALIWGILNTFFHELGHVISGKIRGFKFYSMTVWFFHIKMEKGKLRFGFNWLGNEAGYTEMLPTKKENVGKAFKKMTLGGINASLIMTVLSVLLRFFLFFGVFLGVIWASRRKNHVSRPSPWTTNSHRVPDPRLQICVVPT
jgi:hypothetical protein